MAHQCWVLSLSVLVGVALSDPPTSLRGAVQAEGACRLAVKGEECYEAVEWAMEYGIRQHPEWYPDLTPYSSREVFQDQLHSIGHANCPQPCDLARATNIDFRNQLALLGYDPVSYTLGEPVQGNQEITSKYMGGTYRFATNENKEIFERDGGVKYAPVYGGFCAFAMAAENSLVPPDPLNYKIVDGKLHLFFRSTAADARALWNTDEPKFNGLAQRNWRRKSYKSFNVDFFDGNLAMGGYDPVSYFEDAPVKGKESITTVYAPPGVGPLTATYRFASEENKAKFDSNPTGYMPVDGGFCAFAMAEENALVPADPLSYKFVDGKLHLFYRLGKTDAKALWNAGDEAKFVEDGRRNWANKAFVWAWAYCHSYPYPSAAAVAEQLSSCV